MRRPLPISCPASLFADFRWTFLCPRREIEPESPKTLSVQFQAPPDPPFYVVLTIPIPVRTLQAISQFMYPHAGISLDYHDTDEDRIGTSPFHCQINQRISGKLDFDWAISQPLRPPQQGRFIAHSPRSSDPIG